MVTSSQRRSKKQQEHQALISPIIVQNSLLPVGLAVSQVHSQRCASDLNDERACTIPVRCMAGGTSSAVHTSTAARVPLSASQLLPPTQLYQLLTWTGSATKRRVLLAHTLSLTHSLSQFCCGHMHHRPRVCGRSACVGTHTIYAYQCTRQLMYTKHRRQFRHKKNYLSLRPMASYFFIFVFLVSRFFACLGPPN